MIKVIIVEDEFPGQEFLKNCLTQNFPDISILHVASSVTEAINAIKEHNPDLVFLDIEIIGGTGFDVLEDFKERNFEVIFTTAYSQFALKAIKAQALDYVLKPINIEEFKESVNKFIQKIKKKLQYKYIDTTDSKLSIPTRKGIEYISIDDILYLEADGNYTFIVWQNNKTLCSKNLGELEKQPELHQFVRCHHSFIVNTKKIKQVIKGRSKILMMDNGDKIPVSQRRNKFFADLMRNK